MLLNSPITRDIFATRDDVFLGRIYCIPLSLLPLSGRVSYHLAKFVARNDHYIVITA